MSVIPLATIIITTLFTHCRHTNQFNEQSTIDGIDVDTFKQYSFNVYNNNRNDNSIFNKLNFCATSDLKHIRGGLYEFGISILKCNLQVLFLIAIGITLTLCTNIIWSPNTYWWILPFVCTVVFVLYVFTVDIRNTWKSKFQSFLNSLKTSKEDEYSD